MKKLNIHIDLLNNPPLIAILLLASFLRFYSYETRWALAYDQAWFAVIARHALNTFQLPLLGPFASGGPFQTGGEWFWIVMLGTLLNPFSVISPWIFITLLSILQVFLLYKLGELYKGKKFGYLLALFGAVSTSQTLQATNLTSQMTASICATLMIMGIFYYFKTKSIKALFLVGFFGGLSSAIHLQGVLLLIPLALFVIIARILSPKKITLLVAGLVVPWIPVFVVDIQNNLYNTKNMILYFTHDQSQVTYEELGRRWLTFILEYLPSSWGRIIGGNVYIGYITGLISAFAVIYLLLKRKMTKEVMFISGSILMVFIVLRYIRTPLYENYITFLHPFILLLVSLSLYIILRKIKLLFYLAITIILIGSISATIKDVNRSTNETAKFTKQYVDLLKHKYPGEKFAIYDYKRGYTHSTLPLVLYLQTEGLIDDNGRKIGFAIATEGAQIKFIPHKAIHGEVGAYQLFDLSSSSSAMLGKNDWAFVNPSVIYDSVQKWYKK